MPDLLPVKPGQPGPVPAGPQTAKEAVDQIEKVTKDLFFVVPSGTQIEILPDDAPKPGAFALPNIPGGHYKVKILTGGHEGKVGWVAGHFVRKKQLSSNK